MHKISVGANGLGTVSPELVEKRALELARIDGRAMPNEADRASAQAELLGPADLDAAPETVDSGTEDLVTWDEPVEASGYRAPRLMADDDATIGETLIEEGLEEADHNQRVSAFQTNPPEEE